MSGKRKTYTPAYRREAARQVIETGRPIWSAAVVISSSSEGVRLGQVAVDRSHCYGSFVDRTGNTLH